MEQGFSTPVLIGFLFGLILLSAFFSGSETALMRVNRYRLSAKARKGHRGARVAARLLEKPDQLIGLILLGNNVVNIAATVLATLIAQRIGWGPEIVPIILTPIVLIFAELAPKTVAAYKPESIAYPAAIIYAPLLWVFLPFIYLINKVANGLLKLFGFGDEDESLTSLSSEELRLAVKEAGTLIPQSRQTMLLRVLDLDSVTVEDIMIPRADINGIDMDDDWDDIVSQLRNSPHTRIPVYRDEYEKVEGILHLRKVVPQLMRDSLSPEALRSAMIPAYYAPEDTPLNRQLLNFQNDRHRMSLVVDEYGDVQGLVTLGDLLAEIVGDFQDGQIVDIPNTEELEEGIFQVDGASNLRELNRSMGWNFPTNGAKTLSGLIVDHLETIPTQGTSLILHGYSLEVVHVRDNTIKTLKVSELIDVNDPSDTSE
ncbi:MAG: HlyC/CorC family transporter [Gammaproteobacteria bacterium]